MVHVFHGCLTIPIAHVYVLENKPLFHFNFFALLSFVKLHFILKMGFTGDKQSNVGMAPKGSITHSCHGNSSKVATSLANMS